MILVGYSATDVLLGILYVSLALFVIVISYRKLLQYLGKGQPVKEDYCVLYSLETVPARGEVTFYFTADASKKYALKILDAEMNELSSVKEGECSAGGNIVRFDTTSLSNGEYYYSLQTNNQKTSKKMTVSN